MKSLYLYLIVGFISFHLKAQEATSYITGRIVISLGQEREGVYDARVDLLKDGNDLKGRVKTDGDGNFKIGPVEPGNYSLKIWSVETPEPRLIPHIPLTGDKTVAMGNVVTSSVIICGCPIVNKKPWNGSTGTTFKRDEISHVPKSQNVNRSPMSCGFVCYSEERPQRKFVKCTVKADTTKLTFKSSEKPDGIIRDGFPCGTPFLKNETANGLTDTLTKIHVSGCGGSRCAPNVYYIDGTPMISLPELPISGPLFELGGVPAEFEGPINYKLETWRPSRRISINPIKTPPSIPICGIPFGDYGPDETSADTLTVDTVVIKCPPRKKIVCDMRIECYTREYYTKIQQVPSDSSSQIHLAENLLTATSKKESLICYPNPTRDNINIEINGSANWLYLIDNYGKCLARYNISTQPKLAIHLGDFSAGVYFLQAEIDGQLIVRKVILVK